MKTLREWARDHRLPLHEGIVRYIAVQKWGKSRMEEGGTKGFAVYGTPMNDQLKAAGQPTIVWVGSIRRDTAAEQQLGAGKNMALSLSPDPRMPKQVGSMWTAILDISRANELLDDFQAFQQEMQAADVQSQTARPNYGKKGNARLIMPPDDPSKPITP